MTSKDIIATVETASGSVHTLETSDGPRYMGVPEFQIFHDGIEDVPYPLHMTSVEAEAFLAGFAAAGRQHDRSVRRAAEIAAGPTPTY